MTNIITPNANINVVQVTSPGPLGPRGAAGPVGPPGTITGNSGVNSTGSSVFSGSVTIIGTLTVTGSNTFINIGPALFTGSVGVSGSLSAISSSAQYFSGSGAGLSNIPASAISGLNISTFRISSGSVSASVAPGAVSFAVNTGASNLFTLSNSGLGTFLGGLTVNGTAANLNAGLNVSTGNTVINSPSIQLIGSATLNGQPITTAGDLTLNQIKSGAVTASVSTGQNSMLVQNGATTLMAVSSSGYVSASGFIGDGSRLSNVGITYLSGSNPLINSIEVADFDNNVAVTYVGGNLKFIFGTPVVPSAPSVGLSGFSTDRFNKVSDNYDVTANWSVGGYTLVSAKLYYTVTGQLLTSTTSGTSFNIPQTTTGSAQTYRIEVTSSSPLDGSINQQSSTTTGTLSKSRPNVPTVSISSNTVQLGISSDQIEEGATGDIAFSAAYGSANSWQEVSLTTSPSSSPQSVSSATGTVSISATSNYQSPAGENDPQIFDSRTTTITYSRIRSLRYGASSTTSFSESDLQDLEIWDTGLGGTIGTIAKGTLNPSGQSVTITWTGDKYHYIVMSSAYTLSNITTGGFGVLSAFTATTVGNYRVYRTNTLQAGGAGTSITYVLT